MPTLKTQKNKASVKQFIDGLENSRHKKDCLTAKIMMLEVTGKCAKMWGDSIIGFSPYHYKYASGREGD